MRRARTCIGLGAAVMTALSLGSVSALAEESGSDRSRRDSDVAPYALWTGARIGVFAPYGGLYSANNLVTTGFQDLASPGPAIELDAGGRLASHFTAYGFWEYTSLGHGSLASWSETRGGQTTVNTNAAGVAGRWMSNPDGFGFVLDVGVGYRWFAAHWNDGTSMHLGGFGDLRLGLGADLAVSNALAVSPMLTLTTGAFTDRTYAGQPVGQFNSSYAALTFSVGVHFDLFGG